MLLDPPFTVYQGELSALSHGFAVWNPSPPKNTYNNVSIGDVGYMYEGTFIRMFNVTLPWDHPSNGFLGGQVEPYDPLDYDPSRNTINVRFAKVDYYSRFVTAVINGGNLQAETPDGVTYKFRNRGALLSLPNGGHRKDVFLTKGFKDYIRDHAERWFNWAQDNNFGVERMEDLILVTGCTLVTSWAAAAFVGNTSEAEISLASRTFGNVGASFVWDNVRGPVSYHNSRFDPEKPSTMANQCVFIRGCRAERFGFTIKQMRGAAGPRPDDPDDADYSREDKIRASRVPGAPKSRDPLVRVLDYNAEKYQTDNVEEGVPTSARHDDLRPIIYKRYGDEGVLANARHNYLQLSYGGQPMPVFNRSYGMPNVAR